MPLVVDDVTFLSTRFQLVDGDVIFSFPVSLVNYDVNALIHANDRVFVRLGVFGDAALLSSIELPTSFRLCIC